jgi:hypothetical protein
MGKWMYGSTYLTSALVGDDWLTSHPGSFSQKTKSLHYPLASRAVGPESGLAEVERRIFLPLPGHDSDPSIVVIPTALLTIPKQ